MPSAIGFVRLALVAALALPLVACQTTTQSDREPARNGPVTNQEGLPELTGDPAPAHVVVDPAEVARVISAYRRSIGLGPVTVSPRLNAIAQTQADAMARTGVVSHTIAGQLVDRLAEGGYATQRAGENLGAGFRNLDEAMLLWKASEGHNANLLMDGVTEIGIATTFDPTSRYRNFWALVLAAPLN